MTEKPLETPPGWYQDPQRENSTHYWDGNRWATPLLESIELREAEKVGRQYARAKKLNSRNTKLSTIGHFAWIVASIGALISLFSGADPAGLTIGLSLITAGASLWLTWLAVGAIVDAINNRN